MFKLILIDDEKEKIDTIKTIINWNAYDIDIISEAYDGKSALKQIEKHLPDIALIDIQMPLINGLELIEIINSKYTNLKTIILSGHDNFKYAQKAIKLETVDYLLKPCRPEQILKAVLKAKNILIEESKRKNIYENYNTLLDNHTILMKENYLKNLLNSKSPTPNNLESQINNLNINLKGSIFCAAVFRNYELEDEELKPLYSEQIKNKISKSLSSCCCLEIITLNFDIIILCSTKNTEQFHHNLLTKLEYIRTSIVSLFNTNYTIGVGTCVNDLSDIKYTYSQAISSLEASFFLGCNIVIPFNEFVKNQNFNFYYPIKVEKEILDGLKDGYIPNIEKLVQKYYSYSSNYSIDNKKHIQKISISLLSNIFYFIVDYNLENKSINNLIFNSHDEILKIKTLTQLESEIVHLLKTLLSEIKTRKKVNRFVQFAIDYFHQHYNENISLATVANEINISPAYLSLLFKQDMGTTFVDFLNHYRIKKAKELLKDIKYKNYEIAYLVGFKDEKYFYQIFKRYTGLTANQYRETLK